MNKHDRNIGILLLHVLLFDFLS